MKKFIALFYLSTIIYQPSTFLYSADLIFTPQYSVEDALAVPQNREIAVDLLWDKWKKIPTSAGGKTGLVLSGGGARGFGHVGVLEHLQEVGFPIDAVVGTSMGAVIGGLYAAGIPILDIEQMAEDTGFRKLSKFTRWTFLKLGLKNGLASAKPWKNWLDKKLGDKTFKDLKIPFIACVTDLASGELIMLRHGHLATSLLAAGTIPGLFAPVPMRQYFLVDGGLLLNVPVSAAKLLNMDNLLISDVSAREHIEAMTRPPSSLAALYRVIEIQGTRLEEKEYKEGDYRLRFYPKGISLLDLWRWREAWEAGLAQSRNDSHDLRLAFIRKTLNQLGRNYFKPFKSAHAARAAGKEKSNESMD